MSQRIAGIDRPLVTTVGAGLIGQALLVASGPFLARALGPVDRGHFAVLVLVPAVAVQVFGQGLPKALAFHAALEGPIEAAKYHAAARGLAPRMVVAAMALAAVVLATYVGLQSEVPGLAALASLALAPSLFTIALAQGSLQGSGDMARFNLVRSLAPLTTAVYAILAFLLDGDLLFTALTATVTTAGAALIGLMLTPDVARSMGTEASAEHKRRVLGYGRRSMLADAPATQVLRLDQVAVAMALGPAALGYFVVALSVTNLPMLLAQSVGMARFASITTLPTSKRRSLVGQTLGIAAVLMGAAVVVLEVSVSWLIPTFFGVEFTPSVPVARILILGGALVGVRRILADVLQALGRPTAPSSAELIAAVATIVIVPVAGRYGGLTLVAWTLVTIAAFVTIVPLRALRRAL